MVILGYVHGWSSGEPYDVLVTINSTEEGADEALALYLSKFPLDSDGNPYKTSISLESMDSFTASTRQELKA